MRVLSVEPVGNADVYNMEVDVTHDFIIQGGVVAHNCLDDARYMCMARPIPPRNIKKKVTVISDPLNQFTGEQGKQFDKYNALTRR